MVTAIQANKKKMTFGEMAKASWKHGSFLYIFIAMLLFYIIANIQYINWHSLTNILTHTAVVGTVALGMGLIIISGDIDLSVGANFAFSGGLGILAYNEVYAKSGHGVATLVAIIVVVACAATIGFINGFMIGKLKMPAFIATLGTMLIFRSLCKYILKAIPTSGGQQQQTYQLIDYYNSPFYSLGNERLLTIPIVGLVLIALVVLIWYFAKYTKFGRKIYALGSNSKAASLAGINVPWTRVIIFTIAGALIGIAALLHIGIYSSMDSSTAGMSYELYAIASCVIGGIAMTGGRGNIIGILFGALSFQIIDKIIAALGLNPLINDTIKGSILLVAVIIQVITIDRAAINKFLQRTGLKFNPDQALLLEGELRKKVNNVKLKYDKKFKAVLAKNLTKEDADVLINKLLDEREAKIVALNNKYDLLMDNANLKAKEVARSMKIKDAENSAKNKLKELKIEQTLALKQYKGEVGPQVGLVLAKQNEFAKELYETAVKENEKVFALKNDMSVLYENAEHVLKRDSQINKEKAQAVYDKKVTKLNADAVIIKTNHEVNTNNLKAAYEATIEKNNALIEANKQNEDIQKQQNEERLQVLAAKKALIEEKRAAKQAAIEEKRAAKKAIENAEKEEMAKRVAYLESVAKNRGMRL